MALLYDGQTDLFLPRVLTVWCYQRVEAEHYRNVKKVCQPNTAMTAYCKVFHMDNTWEDLDFK